MYTRLTTALGVFGMVMLLAGCSTNGAGTNATNAASATGSTDAGAALKQEFVSITASAHAAIDDFQSGTSLNGPMDTVQIDGKTYDVVAATAADLDNLKKGYLDILSAAAVDKLFQSVQEKQGKYVIEATSASDNLNWFKATVIGVKSEANGGYLVTLSVPHLNSAGNETQSALINEESGHLVYAGSGN